MAKNKKKIFFRNAFPVSRVNENASAQSQKQTKKRGAWTEVIFAVMLLHPSISCTSSFGVSLSNISASQVLGLLVGVTRSTRVEAAGVLWSGVGFWEIGTPSVSRGFSSMISSTHKQTICSSQQKKRRTGLGPIVAPADSEPHCGSVRSDTLSAQAMRSTINVHQRPNNEGLSARPNTFRTEKSQSNTGYKKRDEVEGPS